MTRRLESLHLVPASCPVAFDWEPNKNFFDQPLSVISQSWKEGLAVQSGEEERRDGGGRGPPRRRRTAIKKIPQLRLHVHSQSTPLFQVSQSQHSDGRKNSPGSVLQSKVVQVNPREVVLFAMLANDIYHRSLTDSKILLKEFHVLLLAWAVWQLEYCPTVCGTLRKHFIKPYGPCNRSAVYSILLVNLFSVDTTYW